MKLPFSSHSSQLNPYISLPLVVLLLLAVFPLRAQQVLTGSVFDMRTHAFLSGVNLTISNTAYGTISTVTGSFLINASAVTFPVEITVSRSGYLSQKVQVANAAQPLEIALLRQGDNEREIPVRKGNQAEYHAKFEALKIALAQVKWEAQPAVLDGKTEYVLGIAGYNPFDQELFSLQNIQLHNRPLVIRFLDPATLTEANMPQAVLISQPDPATAERLGKLLWGTSVLTIGDRCENTSLNTVLSLLCTDGKANIKVNKALAALAGISFAPAAPNVLVIENP